MPQHNYNLLTQGQGDYSKSHLEQPLFLKPPWAAEHPTHVTWIMRVGTVIMKPTPHTSKWFLLLKVHGGGISLSRAAKCFIRSNSSLVFFPVWGCPRPFLSRNYLITRQFERGVMFSSLKDTHLLGGRQE